MTHTPGKWKVSRHGSYGPFIETDKYDDPEYGAASHDIGIERHSIATCHGNNSTANARLIAAAPELLAACKAARLEAIIADKPGLTKKLDAAIAKTEEK